MIILYMFNLGQLSFDEWRFEIFGVASTKVFLQKILLKKPAIEIMS